MTREEHDSLSIPWGLLPKALATADQIMEAMGDRCTDSELRRALIAKVLEAVAQETTNEIDWDAISDSVTNQVMGQ